MPEPPEHPFAAPHSSGSRATTRLWIAAGVVFLCSLSTWLIQAGYAFSIRAPARDLSALPASFGSWQGADRPMEEGTADVLNAREYINREYQDSTGRSIMLHAAVWTTHEDVCAAAPHHPATCYPAAGWQIVAQQSALLETKHGRLPLQFCLMESEGRRIVTAHWYQLGNERFTSQRGALPALTQLWGRREWPPVLKVLVQTPAPDIESARSTLDELAQDVFAWTSHIDRASASR